ncbi:response regulator [Evansella halocellulosilytica]|uniref:response regulator n=1 Tax=Evansella halocellulosilytica TaxID=2011013 RepID=UPI000BB73ACF|nr:response regulator [Evansella halocellulosilytica]
MIKILYVDQAGIYRDGLRILLENEEDMSVLMVEPHDERIKKAIKLKPDLVLINSQIQSTDRIKITNLIKKQQHHVQMIYLLPSYKQSLIVKGIREGADGFISNKCAPEELVEVVREYYGKKQSLSRNEQRNELRRHKSRRKKLIKMGMEVEYNEMLVRFTLNGGIQRKDLIQIKRLELMLTIK